MDPIRSQLEELIDQWRAHASLVDTYHATMGTGWKVCAREVAALLMAIPPPQVEEKEQDTKNVSRVDVECDVPTAGSTAHTANGDAPKFTKNQDSGDWECEHGTASDVHCCGCHSGFLFDSRKCVCF